MKKLLLMIAATVLVAGMAQAQVVDTNLINNQNNPSLQQQQQEAAAKAAREAEKEQSRIDKEQARQQREQAKADKEQKQAQKQARHEARRERIGRSTALVADPYVSLGSTTRALKYSDPLNTRYNYNLGINVLTSYPLNKRWDLGFGVGFRWGKNVYTNNVVYDETDRQFGLDSINTDLGHKSTLAVATIMVPLHLVHISKQGKANYFFGVDFGYNIKNYFANKIVSDNAYTELGSFNNTSSISDMRADLIFGIYGKQWLWFRRGCSIYFNLVPTYVAGENGGQKIHEFGFTYHL